MEDGEAWNEAIRDEVTCESTNWRATLSIGAMRVKYRMSVITAEVGNNNARGTFEREEGMTESVRDEASMNMVSDKPGTERVMHSGERMARTELRHSMEEIVR